MSNTTDWSEIRVVFKKSVSDGNYGTESAEVTLQEWIEADTETDTQKAIAEELLAQARAHVHAELARSPARKVRAALNDPDQSNAVGHVLVAADDSSEESPF